MAGLGVAVGVLGASTRHLGPQGAFLWGPMQIAVAVLAAGAVAILVVIALRLRLLQRRERRPAALVAGVQRPDRDLSVSRDGGGR